MNLYSKISSLITICGGFFIAFSAFAQQVPQYVPLQITSVQTFIDRLRYIVQVYITGLFMIMAVAAILYSGYLFITAGDDESAVSAARQWLTWGIVGILVGLLAFSLPDIIRTLFQ